jgi:hypothetical protein
MSRVKNIIWVTEKAMGNSFCDRVALIKWPAFNDQPGTIDFWRETFIMAKNLPCKAIFKNELTTEVNDDAGR